jgi:hypothetical protein
LNQIEDLLPTDNLKPILVFLNIGLTLALSQSPPSQTQSFLFSQENGKKFLDMTKREVQRE